MTDSPSVYTNRKKVLGYPVDVVNERQALEAIERSWAQGRGMHVVTLNAEMVIQAQKDRELDRIIRHAHLIVPDGAGAVWALRLDGHPSVRVPGIELAHRALTSAGQKGVPVALLGSRQEVIDKLHEILPFEHPGIDIVASHDGFFSAEEEQEVVADIAGRKPRLVLVAMGVPRQEYFIDRWSEEFAGAVVIGVGGSFDVWGGFVKRAPAFYRKLHLEWFYRLTSEPWRARRILSALPSFALQVLARRLFGGREDDNDGGHPDSPRKAGKWQAKKIARDKSRERSKDH